MKIAYHPIGDLIASRKRKFAAFSSERSASNQIDDVQVSDATGFHIYGDLHLTLELSAATDQASANRYLELLDDYSGLAAAFADGDRDLFIFEIQGERMHLFLNAPRLDATAVEKLIRVTSNFINAVYRVIGPKAEPHWRGFCMAADHGRAAVLATGRDGDDSLLSLGDAANKPAKRLAKSPQIKAGHIAIPRRMLAESGLPSAAGAPAAARGWIEINARDRMRDSSQSREIDASVTIFENEKRAAIATVGNRFVALAADPINTGGATVDAPRLVQGLHFRADLCGFTSRVAQAFAQGTNAVSELVSEFIAIMRIPDAFEEALARPFIRLPWAGDCYNGIFLPRPDEDYAGIRLYLPAVLALRWFDPRNELNGSRDARLARIAKRQQWSVGVAGGESSQGRLLVANVQSMQRPFLIAAGWGCRRSLDAHNAEGLNPDEAALHSEDHSALDDTFATAFRPWDGPTDYRKATKERLENAEQNRLQRSAAPAFSVSVPAPRPYFDGHRNSTRLV